MTDIIGLECSGYLVDPNTNEITDKKVASDVKKIKKMTENIKEPIAVVDSEEPEPEPETNPLEAIMGNSDIGKLAEEVSKELDIESMFGGIQSDNPMEIFQNLMSGGAMNKIMGTIHNVVNDKVEKGELNKDEMLNEAQGIYGQLGQTDMFQQMAQQAQQSNQRAPQQSSAQQNNPHQSNKTKARLQKKLKEKKEKQKVQVSKVE